MKKTSFYNQNTYRAMIFKPNDYIASVIQDENFLQRLQNFRNELQEKKASLPKQALPVVAVNKPAKKKKRKKTKPSPAVELSDSSQPQIESGQKTTPCNITSLAGIQKMLSQSITFPGQITAVINQYEQALITLKKHKSQLTIQGYNSYNDFIRQQLTLARTKPGLYYMQRASFNEKGLDQNNLTTPQWAAVISDYEAGVKSLMPANKGEHTTKKRSFYILIDFYKGIKDYDKAIDYCTQLITAYPKEAKAYCLRAICYSLSEQDELVMADLNQAISYKDYFSEDDASYCNEELDKLKEILESRCKEQENILEELSQLKL